MAEDEKFLEREVRSRYLVVVNLKIFLDMRLLKRLILMILILAM